MTFWTTRNCRGRDQPLPGAGGAGRRDSGGSLERGTTPSCDHDADSVIHTQFQAQTRLHLAGVEGEATVHTSELGCSQGPHCRLGRSCSPGRRPRLPRTCVAYVSSSEPFSVPLPGPPSGVGEGKLVTSAVARPFRLTLLLTRVTKLQEPLFGEERRPHDPTSALPRLALTSSRPGNRTRWPSARSRVGLLLAPPQRARTGSATSVSAAALTGHSDTSQQLS